MAGPGAHRTTARRIIAARDEFLVAIDRDALETRLDAYFDPAVSHEDIRTRFPSVMTASARFDPIKTRKTLMDRGKLATNVGRHAYRPFDVRWLYWEPETKLLDEKRGGILAAHSAEQFGVERGSTTSKRWK
jgi:hypothetical protein